MNNKLFSIEDRRKERREKHMSRVLRVDAKAESILEVLKQMHLLEGIEGAKIDIEELPNGVLFKKVDISQEEQKQQAWDRIFGLIDQVAEKNQSNLSDEELDQLIKDEIRASHKEKVNA